MNYRYKYLKYKNKYLKQIGSNNQKTDNLELLTKRINNENISVSLAKEIYEYIEKSHIENTGNEEMHILEDRLKNKFIANIADKKIINIDDIQTISYVIKKINDIDYTRWYA